MADFYISGIRRDKESDHIQQLEVIRAGKGLRMTTDRAFVADLISLGTTFKTIFWSNGVWRLGASVHVLQGHFLATDPNAKKEDNLESLPLF